MTVALTSLYAVGYASPVSPTGAENPVRSASGTRELVRRFAYCIVGTMGLLTPQTVEAAYATSAARVHFVRGERGDATQHVGLERTAAENLAHVRAVLKPSVLELASLFGVSRQAVYDWQTGAQPAAQAADGLTRLARAADIFDEANVQVDAKTLRRKVAGGNTLLSTILRGGDAELFAQGLVATIKREATQRARLQVQLAGRNRAPMDLSSYGSPSIADDA